MGACGSTQKTVVVEQPLPPAQASPKPQTPVQKPPSPDTVLDQPEEEEAQTRCTPLAMAVAAAAVKAALMEAEAASPTAPAALTSSAAPVAMPDEVHVQEVADHAAPAEAAMAAAAAAAADAAVAAEATTAAEATAAVEAAATTEAAAAAQVAAAEKVALQKAEVEALHREAEAIGLAVAASAIARAIAAESSEQAAAPAASEPPTPQPVEPAKPPGLLAALGGWVTSKLLGTTALVATADSGELHEAELAEQLKGRAAAAFAAIDKNGDGVLTRIEVIQACRRDAAVRELLGLPLKIRQEGDSRDAFEALFQALDKDGSKTITLAEFQALFVESEAAEASAHAELSAPPGELVWVDDGRGGYVRKLVTAPLALK
jgi:hypothetical protein